MVFFQQPLLQVLYPMLPQLEVQFLQTGCLLTPCLHLLRVHVTSCDFACSPYREGSTTDRVGSHRLSTTSSTGKSLDSKTL